jgi:hypothetical protein
LPQVFLKVNRLEYEIIQIIQAKQKDKFNVSSHASKASPAKFSVESEHLLLSDNFSLIHENSWIELTISRIFEENQPECSFHFCLSALSRF